jgi:uncharacterized protein YegL
MTGSGMCTYQGLPSHALNRALELIRDKVELYKVEGIPYYRPVIFLITDGHPTDDWQSAANTLKETW